MTFPASAKITRPQPGRALARTRLYQRLDDARPHPVVWIGGPPGAGKTTLVSSYLESQGSKGIWYQVDAGDEDPATFFHYMGMAARHAAPRYRKPLPLLTSEHFSGLAVFARRYFEALFARLKAPAVVVLDNYQEVAKDSAFHAVVAEAAAVLPEGVTLFIISRAEPPATFARLRANGILDMLDSAELKLTLDESSGIAGLCDKRKLNAAVLERLHKRTEGWTAGLVLLLNHSDQGVQALSPAPVGASYQVLFDYFATEIFHKLETTTQSILCQAALFPKASVDWVRELTGNPEAGAALADLYRRNYFVVKHGQDEVYQFHPLFHAFLLHRAQEVFPPSQINTLRSQAGALLETAGDIEAAAELWLAASNWQTLEAHILKHAPALAAQARFQTLETWLCALPTDTLDQKPWLRYWLGICRMQFDLAQAGSHFEQAYAGFTRVDEAAGLYASWSGVVGCVYQAWRDFTTLSRWLEELENLRRRHPQWPSFEIEMCVVTGAVMAYSGHRPDHPDLRHWLAHAGRLISTSTNNVHRTQLATHVAMVLYWLGENQQATLIIQSVEPVGNGLQNAPVTEAWWSVTSMLSYWHRLMPRAAVHRCNEALASSEASGIRVVDPLLYSQGAYAALMAGDLSTAEKFVQAMHVLLQSHSPLASAHYWHVRALTDLHAGRVTTALDHSRQALSLAQSASMPYGNTLCHLALAMALLEMGELEVAQEHVHAARVIGVAMKSRSIEFRCSAHEARAAFDQGNLQMGRIFLARTLALSREIGGAHLPWWPRSQIARLYAIALDYDIETDHVCDLIRRLDLGAPDGRVPDTWPFPVKIYTLGRFSLHIDNKPLIFAGKAQKKPLELLKGLIAFGGREVREDKLACALWPLAEDAPQALAITVHRLRKLIGENAIERSEGCLTLNPRYCWVDVWAFERQITRVNQACQERRLAEIVPQIEHLFARYSSGFLPAESDVRWALAPRERLRCKLLFQIETVANVLSVAHQHDAAIACYRKALEIDPLMEALYCGLMQCYAATGRHAEALSTYERCRRMLNEQLGVKPSPRTEALACQFRAN